MAEVDLAGNGLVSNICVKDLRGGAGSSGTSREVAVMDTPQRVTVSCANSFTRNLGDGV